jgi:hypothetical protein
MKRARPSLPILLILLAVPAGARGGQQTSFGIEERVTRPARIPAPVFRMLKDDERVRECAGDSQKKPRVSWFEASAIDLNRDGLPDYVVKAENVCLLGANIAPFWVFRSTPTGYELALKTYSLGLDVLPSRTRGHRDIRVDAASAVEIFSAQYKFDGRRYVPWKCWQQSIDDSQQGDRGKVYVQCSDNVQKPYR